MSTLRSGLQVASRIFSIFLISLMVIMVVFTIGTLIARAATGNPNATPFGGSVAIVISGSMEPTIYENDIVIAVKRDEYQVGDIVMYTAQNGMSITHRIIDVRLTGYVVQGDANPLADPPITHDQVVGRVEHIIPKVGKPLRFLKSREGMPYLIGGIAIAASVALVLPKLRKKNEFDTH